MIFSVGNHVDLIIKGEKTQTRRKSSLYRLGKTYAIQRGRTQKGIIEGRIIIIKKRIETSPKLISLEDSKAEGNYDPEEFEKLYTTLYPNWVIRWVYTFRFLRRLTK